MDEVSQALDFNLFELKKSSPTTLLMVILSVEKVSSCDETHACYLFYLFLVLIRPYPNIRDKKAAVA
jgi:hypothetical protein